MKKMMILMAMMVTIATRAAAMSYTEARAEALFLTDKMAYELNLSNAQYEAVYEINLDYLMALSSHTDVLGSSWVYRNHRLSYVLSSPQYDRYVAATYFYHPVSWTSNRWHFAVYSRYTDRTRLFRARPVAYNTYRGPEHPHVANHTVPARPTTRPNTTRPTTTTRPNTTNRGNFGAHR